MCPGHCGRIFCHLCPGRPGRSGPKSFKQVLGFLHPPSRPPVQSLIHPLIELQLWARPRDGTEDAAVNKARVAPALVAGRLSRGHRDSRPRAEKRVASRPLCCGNSVRSRLVVGPSLRRAVPEATPRGDLQAEGRAAAGRGGARGTAPSARGGVAAGTRTEAPRQRELGAGTGKAAGAGARAQAVLEGRRV